MEMLIDDKAQALIDKLESLHGAVLFYQSLAAAMAPCPYAMRKRILHLVRSCVSLEAAMA